MLGWLGRATLAGPQGHLGRGLAVWKPGETGGVAVAGTMAEAGPRLAVPPVLDNSEERVTPALGQCGIPLSARSRHLYFELIGSQRSHHRLSKFFQSSGHGGRFPGDFE